MLDLKQIESFYPEALRPFRRNLLREYLQYKTLEVIFSSKSSSKLVFMGGTAIHILHGNPRFSEDLDFDNLSLGQKDFKDLADLINKRLTQEGYTVETNTSFKKAFRCFIHFPGLLFETGLSRQKDEKLHLQLDADPQNFKYPPDKIILNKFDVFLQIATVPIEILCAQKITCILKRPRPMGRDFYDTVFLLGKTRPNFEYLREKLNIHEGKELRSALLKKCQKLNFSLLAKDIEPFLFNPSDAKKILHFQKWIESLTF